jgi:hypothetical protein
VLGRGYTKACDLWSLGVVAYTMLCGYPPFWGDSEREIYGRVRRGLFFFEGPEWATRSRSAKDFVARLLVVQPHARLSAVQAALHPWILHEGAPPDPASRELLAPLRRFAAEPWLTKLAAAAVAATLPPPTPSAGLRGAPSLRSLERAASAANAAAASAVNAAAHAAPGSAAPEPGIERHQAAHLQVLQAQEQELARALAQAPQLEPHFDGLGRCTLWMRLAFHSLLQDSIAPSTSSTSSSFDAAAENSAAMAAVAREARERERERDRQCGRDETPAAAAARDAAAIDAANAANAAIASCAALTAPELLAVLRRRGALSSSAAFVGGAGAGADADAEREARALLLGLDVDRDGALGFEDLRAALLPRACLARPEAMQAAFRALDVDGDGIISVNDVAAALRARARARAGPHALGRAPAPLPAPVPWRSALLCQSGGGGGAVEPADGGSDSELPFAASVIDEALGLCGGWRAGAAVVRFADFVRIVAPPRDEASDPECAR